MEEDLELAMKILKRHFSRVEEDLLREMAETYVVHMIEEFGEEGAEGLVEGAAQRYRMSRGRWSPTRL